MGATGYVLTIPDEVLKKLELADTKINAIAESSEKTANRFNQAFSSMALSVDPLIKRLDALKNIGKLDLGSGLKKYTSDSEKAAAGIAEVANKLNQLKYISSQSSSANNSVLAWQGINENLKIQQQRLDAINRSIKEYENTLSQIQSGKGGVLSKEDQSNYASNLAEAESIKQTIALYQQKQQAIVNYQLEQKKVADNLAKLKSLESDSKSLPEQRKREELERLNALYRSGQSLLQKQAKAEDELGKAAQKVAIALDKAAKAEEKKNSARANKANQEAARAEEQYARALNKSEVTIVQRARKIEALANAQRALNSTGRDYSSQLSKIASETQRLQQANDNVAKSMERVKRSQSSVLNTTDQLTRKIALLFSVSAIQGYVEKLVSVRGEFELQQRALQAILQNKDEANALWEKTVALAVKSPFQVKELVTYTKQLAAYKIEADKLYDTTKMLADVSAGLGVDMGRLILAYGQVKAANYLRASEVRQFTEAGVGLLQELATMYTELEGRMVSVGEVQARITKRMVAFGDIEEVFKRITSAGGIFYNMQEIQAETLAGMISNLKDNFDVMFNEIGKANDGVLKGFINILNTIVAQWRDFAIALNTAGAVFVTYSIKAAIAAAANRKIGVSAAEAMIAQGGLTKAIGYTTNALIKSFNFVKANPWILVATAIAGTIFYLKDLTERLDETRATYDVLNNQIDTQKSNLESLTNKIEKQVKAQEDAESSLSNVKKGTQEYKEAEQKANEEREKTQKLLNILKTQYPEVYAKVMQNKEGIKSLASEQKKYNDELERTSVLNKLMQADVPLIGESFKEQAEAYTTSLDKQKKASTDLKNTYKALTSELNYLFKTDSKIPDYLKQNAQLVINSNDNIEKKTKLLISYSEAISRHTSTSNRTLNTLRKNAEDSLNSLEDANENRVVQMQEMNKSYVSLRDNALKEANITLAEFKALSKEQQEDLGKRMATFIKSSAGAESNFARFFLKNRIKQDLGISISYDEKEVEKEMTDLQKKLSEYVNEYNNKPEIKGKNALKLPIVTAETDVEEYRDKIFAAGKALIEAAQENANSVENLAPHIDKNQKVAIQLAKSAGEAQQALAKLFGYTDKKGEKAGETAYERKIKAQLDLLKKMQSQYEKLRQTMGEEDATSTITSSFGTAYQKLFNKPLKLKFDKASIANEMESISNTISGKSAEALKRSWQNTIGELRSEITVSATLDNISEFERQMDSMFNSYQLYIELEAKGVPKDLIQNLFGIDVTTLDDIARALEEKYPDVTKLGEKELDSYFKIQKKITDNQKNELKRRSDLLYNYLEQSVDKVKQVQNSGALEISFATDFFNKGSLNAEQYATVVKNVTEKVNKEVSKINTDKFKETPEYIQAMGDLSAYSASQLEVMIARMQELINSSAGNLNASDLKVYTDLIDKIQDRLKQIKSPFSKNAFAEFRELKRLQAEFNAETERYNQLLREQKIAKDRLESTKTEAEQARGRIGIDASAKDDLIAATESLQDANSALNNSNDKLNISQGKLSNISGKMGQIQGGMSAAMSMIDKIVTGIYQSINATIDIMNQFKELQESQGVDTSKGGWREAAQAGELLGNVNEKVMSSWNNFKSGNIAGAVADAVGSITSIFTTLNKQHDARREQTIQKEIKQVEKLQKAYQRLGNAIENAYTIDTLNMSTENAQRNIQDQIKSYQNMIAAEEDKKDTDWDRIDEWKEAIIDLQEQADQLRSQKLNELGGFGSGADMKSAAEEFASAWLEAYKETGDGLTALEDKWDEYINNIIMKQLALRGIEKFLEPIMNKLDNMIGDDSYLSNDELKELQDDIDKTMPALNEYWKKLAESFKIPIVDEGGSDNASTLSKSVQGVTESTANVIEAYLNSMRFFVSDSNMVLNNFYMAFTSIDPLLNPMYSELNNQTKLLRSIDERLASVITYSGDHPNGGAALKTVI
jgi:DNA repair exonuclease SbcCD ATPase subunit